MTLKYENQKIRAGHTYIIGCDEVGRGSLAGPVVAAAVILPQQIQNSNPEIRKIRDSKLLNPKKREALSEIIKQHALWSIGVVSQNIIDKINIHHATLLAMKRAVEDLVLPLDSSRPFDAKRAGLARDDSNKYLIAIDGRFTIPSLDVPQEAIIDGDNKVFSIAAASIVAKVYRDQLMTEYHQDYPIYNFAQHKGYGTLYHRKMIIQHGLSPLHRLSFCEHWV